MYVMVESTLLFDDIGVVPDLLQLSLAQFKGQVCGQESGEGDSSRDKAIHP